MMKQLKQAAELFIYLCLISCFVAFALAAGMLLLPFVMLIVLAAAIREIIIWKRKESQRTAVLRAVAKRSAKQRSRTLLVPLLSKLKAPFHFHRNHRRMTLDF